MGLFEKIFKKIVKPVACVYAGPEYFEKKRSKLTKPEPIESVYAGPEMQEPIAPVYAGPVLPEADIEDVYNGPAEPDPEDTEANEGAEYPANHAEEDKPAPPIPPQEFMTAYAGPQMSNPFPMMFVYAGPVRMQDQGGFRFPQGMTMQEQAEKGEMKAVDGKPAKGQAVPEDMPKEAWKCGMCGAMNTGRFCTECGSPRVPSAPGGTYLV
ncbi:MAG: hypothetical protein J6U10_03525 [Lachnospiraceae bacterium]|nr:hypothetical protein [Lachnospiraceae bacterium]